MFRTKKDVDKHVQDINSKIKSSSERNLKGYSIAKLYFGVEDYENARRYLATYLVEKDTSAVAHKLNGQIFEKLKQPEKALGCYKRSYELDPSNDLVLKICGLMITLPIEPGRAKYWVEVGERAVPHSDVVYKLREAMLTASEGENSPALEEVLLQELQARPTDVQLRVRLVTLYQRTGRISEGWQHCCEVEQRQPWPASREWYSCMVEMSENYQVQYRQKCTSEFYTVYLASLDRLVDIMAREGGTASVLADILHRMDQALYEFGSITPPPSQNILSHFKGQLYLGCATLLIKRAVKDQGAWRDTSKLAGLLFLGAFGGEVIPQHSSVGGVRKVIAGHMLQLLAGGDSQWVERVVGVGSNMGERLHKAVFVVRDQRDKINTSCLAQQTAVSSCSTLPTAAELSAHCPAYISQYSSDLHMLVWLLARYYSPGKVLDLTFQLPGAGSAVPRENLTSLDLDSFLYGVVYCVGWEGEREGANIPPLTPTLSPVVTSTVQEAWWGVASKAMGGTLQPSDRRTLQHGVEAIRCTGLHGLDINLTMKLGKTFESLSLESAVASEGDQAAGEIVTMLEERAGIYYRASLVSIERNEKGGGLREPSVRLLQAAGSTPGQGEMDKMKEAAHFFLACQKMHKGDNMEAISAFRELRSPYASFYTAEIYKKMALEERAEVGLGDSGDSVRELLVECREALYLTLDRLRGLGGGHHPLDSQLAEQIEEVENLLAGSGSNGVDAELAPSLPTPVGTPKRSGPALSRLASQLTSTPQANRSLFDGNTSLGRVEARPSPERLDAQMRQLTGELSRTTSQLARTVSQVGEGADMNKVVEVTKEVVDSSNKVLGEIRDNLLPAIKDVFNEVKEIRRDSRDRDEKILEILSKISDNTAAAASNPGPKPSELSEEERLLLDSFGYSGQFQAATAGNMYPFFQQQMLQQQLARQTPNMMAATMGYNMSSMYGNMFNPLATAADIMNPGTPTLTQQLPQLVPTGVMAPQQLPVVIPTPSLPTIPQPQQVVLPQQIPTPANNTTSIQLPPITTPTISKPFSSAPTNVVISVSDPIPLTAPPLTAPMTVTVPPQHRLGGLTNTPRTSTITPTTPMSAYKTPLGTPNPDSPHLYQIKMPAGASPLTTSPFKSGDDPAVTITTQSLLSTIPNPIFSAVTPSPEKPHTTSSHKTRMASGSTPKQRNPAVGGATAEGDEPEEYEPEVEFAPVIPLPEVVEVVTGEEDEEIMFEDRAKLFRFSDETKEWKERGLGQVKILKDKASGKVRFLMRREQTFKVCANHQLTSTMKLDKMGSNKKARIWGAQDFADEELKTEKFCIKFKTEEQAEQFEQKFVEAAEASKNAVSPVKETKKESSGKGGATLAQFAAAQKQSSWECNGCLTRNDNNKIQCLACEGPKPGCEEEVKKLKEAAKPAAQVMTIGAGGGFKFGGATTPASTAASGFNLGASTASTASGFSFGTPSTTTVSASGFSFGTPATSSTAATTTVASSGFSFNTPKLTPAPAASDSKPSIGGFTFSTTPVIKPVEEKVEEKKEEKKTEPAAPKLSPFSGFSFGSSASSATTAFGAAASVISAPAFGSGSSLAFGSKTESVKEEKESTEAAPLFGTKTDVSFSSVASGEGIKADPNFKGFAGSGSSVFGGQKKDGDEEGGADEEYEPDVHFQPVIPLPELVEVKTGEEDEAVLFSERSKLFRFVPETKEWKERGLGDFKILKNNESGRVRFLMRREQVLKVCCNHMLTKSMEFKPLATSDRAWTWTAGDFSEGEVSNELFALKFKTAEMAKNWKGVVDDCQTGISDSPTKAVTLEKKVEPAKTGGTTLAQFAAAQKQSSWECNGCLTRNDNNKIQCLACEGPKPGCEEEVKKLKEAAKPAAPVMTIGDGGGFKFGSGAAPAAASSGFSFGSPAAATTTAASGFLFGTPTATTTASSGFSFGTPSTSTTATNGGFSFNKVEDVTEAPKTPFGTKDSHEFSFSGIKTSPVKPGAISPRKHNESTTSESDLYQDEENDNLYFEPVIPLPDKVDVKTGEEDELVLYSHRAKLFRYLDGEWKERGVGDIKILKNEGVGKVRLLMRRDQVLKICLNHYLTPQLVSQFNEKDPKSWTWAAQDFSEGELESMTFALRFKSPEISSDFKQAIDDAVKNISSTSPVKSDKAVSKKSPEKSKSKTPGSVSKSPEKELFTPAQFKPVEDVANEVELSFEGQGLKLNSAEDAAEVANKISTHGPMHVLTFSANTVGIEAAGVIGKALEKHPEFRRAHWKDMFTGRMKTEIPPALVNLTRGIMTAQARLVELDLSDNAFGPVGMEGLITFLKSPSCFSLQELKLNNTGCGVTGGKMLANLLLDCYNRSKEIGHPLALKVFILGRSRQENEGATALAQVFKLMGSLEEVVMPQNGIYHEGLSALADAFASNPNLRILNMNDNTFTAKGAKAMGAAIKKLNNLEVLNLGDCLLKSGGTKLICKALTGRHPNLKEFVLDSNEIRLKGGLEIVGAVKGKDKLERLSIDGNQFGEDGLKKILNKMEEIGMKDIIGEVEDTEEPDSDEEDPDVSDGDGDDDADEDDKNANTVAAPKPAFSFNAAAVESPSSIFAGSPKSSGSIFGGSSSTSTTSVFGGSSTNTPFKPAGSMFGSKESPGGSIFGKAAESSASMFGKPADTPGIFGASAESSTTPVFGKPATGTPSTNLFGKSTESPSIFGNSSTDTPKATFGSTVFGGASNSPSIFGGSTVATPTTGTGLFGKTAEGQADSTSGTVFGSGSKSTGFDFTSLAENSGPGFNTAGDGFKFAGSGSSLFGKSAKDGDDDGDDENAEEDSHDPHFEPIVPLPELVETKTGEEEEQVVFKHRAKVYRYCGDTKQWKERGVGDIKILKHPASGVTRVLLRRDQVHKIAANHRITKEMELKPLASSETAWCWYAMDFSEGHEESGSLEHLAVRFKHKNAADEFKEKFEKCQEEIGEVVSETVVVPEANVEETAEQGDEDYEGYEDEEDYDENGETIMFHQTATLHIKNDTTGEFMNQGEVDLRIVYDDDVYGARILAEGPSAGSEDDSTVCNHLIAMQTVLNDGPELEWSALDFSTDPPSYRTFRVEFGSDDLKAEFKDMFSEGKELAEQSEILETVGDQDPAQFYYGQGQ